MRYREFGADNRETVMLLHGGGLSWWNYRTAAELLSREYHVILPLLDGHAGSGRPFTSMESSAAEIISFIDEQCGGSVTLLGGLSLGGQIALEMLSQRKDICRFALIESASVLPDRLTAALISPAFGSSYGLIKNRRFAKLQFRSLRIRDDLFEDYYRDTCAISKADMTAFLKASAAYALKPSLSGARCSLSVFAGEKESRRVLKSAEAIRKAVPNCTVTLLPGLYHGEFSINHGEQYADVIREILQNK